MRFGRYFERLLRRLGYVTTLKVVNVGFDYFGAAADPRNHAQIGMHGWLADYPTPATFFDPVLSCAGRDAPGQPEPVAVLLADARPPGGRGARGRGPRGGRGLGGGDARG